MRRLAHVGWNLHVRCRSRRCAARAIQPAASIEGRRRVASSGFTAGGAGLGTRAAGGAISGAVQSGMVGDNPLMGAAVGGALPPAAKLVGAAGSAVGRGVSSMLTPQQQAMAKQIASMTGKKLEGTSEVNNLPVSGFTATYDAKLDIATPATFELSISHALNPNVNVHSSISLTQWSVIENLVIKNSGAPASLSTIIEELDWKDSWAYSVGADWKAGDSLTLRAGLGIDKNNPYIPEKLL